MSPLYLFVFALVLTAQVYPAPAHPSLTEEEWLQKAEELGMFAIYFTSFSPSKP